MDRNRLMIIAAAVAIALALAWYWRDVSAPLLETTPPDKGKEQSAPPAAPSEQPQ